MKLYNRRCRSSFEKDLAKNQRSPFKQIWLAAVRGGSVGGASIASELQARGLAQYGIQTLHDLGVTLNDCKILLQTPAPYQGYSPNGAPYQTDLYKLPTNGNGAPLPYDEMIDSYLDRTAIKQRYRTLLQGNNKIIDIAHFYVEAAVRGALLEELAQEKGYEDITSRILQVTHFHSSPDLTIRTDSPDFHQELGTSWERKMYEIATLHTSTVQFSTHPEREMTARAYDGIHGLTYEHIMANSFSAPLPINTEALMGDNPEQKRAEARDLLELPKDAVVFGMVTRLDTEKGYDKLIEHFVTFITEKVTRGENINNLPYLTIVGGVPEKDPRLRAQVEKIQLMLDGLPEDMQNHVIFPKMARKGSDVFHAFDAYFGPSETETLHLAPKEAGMCEIETELNGVKVQHGVPAFLSDIAAHRETHPDGSAFIFDKNTYKGFEQAFEVACDPVQRIRYGKANAANSKRFGLEESTKSFISALVKMRPNFFTS